MNANVGIRSKADLVVTRNGVVIKELKDCGNMILDNFFVFWKEYHSLDFSYYLNLGSSATPTTADMTSLVSPLPNSKWAHTAYADAVEEIDVSGIAYVETRNTRTFGCTLGAVVGSVRELGISFTPRGAYTGGVCTRIVLPEDFILTAEDQLTVYYTFITRVKRKEEFTFTADLDGTPTDFNVTRWTRMTYARPFSAFIYGRRLNSPYLIAAHANPSNGAGTSPTDYQGVDTIRVFDLNEKTLTVTFNMTTSQLVRESGWGAITPGWANGGNDTYSGPYTFDFNPPFPKTNEQTMTFTFKITLSRL